MAATEERRSRARSITAAAKRIDVRASSSPAAKRSQPSGWQDEAWTYFDEIPEVKFAARFVGSAFSRLRLFPAVALSDNEEPIDLESAAEEPDSGIPPALADAATEEWARLNEGTDGLPGIQREFGVILSVSGDSYLVAREVEGLEQWEVFSESVVTRSPSGRLALRLSPESGAADVEELDEDAFVARIWRRHSRWPGLADSNMRAVLATCEEILIWERQMRSVGRSRNSSGILVITNSADFSAQRVSVAAGAEAGEDEDQLTDLERSLLDSMLEPVDDDGSPMAIVPHILRVPDEAADPQKIFHIALDREIDGSSIERLAHLVGRLAHGLDVPVEILTGVADANHWTAWQIEDSTYKAHIEPLASIPARGLASVYLRPALVERGFDPELVSRVVVGIDPAGLVVRPNRAQDAKDAYDRQALSWEALRRHLGFSDAEAPEPDELLLRYALQRGIGAVALTREAMRATEYAEEIGESDPEDAPEGGEGAEDEGGGGEGGGGEEGGEPTPPTAPASALEVLLAAAVANVGDRLAAIDGRLRERVQAAASSALSDALARAGNRLRSRAQGVPELRERANGIAPEAVGQALGEDGAQLAGPDELIGEEDFAGLGSSFAAWIAAARSEALAVVEREARSRGFEADEISSAAEEALASSEEDDNAGWLLLLAALLALGRSRIFSAEATPDDGEFDPDVAVPPGPVRDALARAGGAVGDLGEPSVLGAGRASGGPASGEAMTKLLGRLGAHRVAWRWEVGLPAVPFPPHQALDGLVFDRWDAPELTNARGFPAFSFYFPGDHRGCQCDAVPFVQWAPDAGRRDEPSARVRQRA